MYEIRFDEKSIEFLERLPKSKRKQMFETIRKTKSNPYEYFKRLRGNWEHSLTSGNIRVIADIGERSKK